MLPLSLTEVNRDTIYLEGLLYTQGIRNEINHWANEERTVADVFCEDVMKGPTTNYSEFQRAVANASNSIPKAEMRRQKNDLEPPHTPQIVRRPKKNCY
jgi:hypothetical protein